MQQKELAILLDISPAMVSRLAKKGMPTDDPERAKRWRKRHLEPGRVKGVRADTIQPKQPAPSQAMTAKTPTVALADEDLRREVETVAAGVNDRLKRGNLYGAAIHTYLLRELFKQNRNPDFSPRLPLRVWVALSDYMLHPACGVRHSPNADEALTPVEFGDLLGPWLASSVLWEVCDFDNNALNGYPEYPDDPEWLAAQAEDRIENEGLQCSRVFGG